MKIINFKFAYLIFLVCLIAPNIASAQAIVIDENSEIAKKYAQEQIIPGSYSVVLSTALAKSDSSKEEVFTKQAIQKLHKKYEFEVTATYSYAFKGFAANMSADVAARMAKDARVKLINPNRVIQAFQQTTPVGISRIGGVGSSTVTGDGSGDVKDVDIFIIDTGIDVNHPDLNVKGGKDFVTSGGLPPGNPAWQDLNGHGTHVAGIAAAKDNSSSVVGVAPGANLYSLRVLRDDGKGTEQDMESAVDWLTQVWLQRKRTCPVFKIDPPPNGRVALGKVNQKIKYKKDICRHMVANISAGALVNTLTYSALDVAVKSSVKAGVFYAVAAGNAIEIQPFYWATYPAKHWSPAHVAEATTVSSYDPSTNTFNHANLNANLLVSYGYMVDILAPGYDVLSTKLGGGTTQMSGTSMATPHVTGTAALYLSKHYYTKIGQNKSLTTPQNVLTALKNNASAPKAGFPNPPITIPAIPQFSGTTTISVYSANF